MNQQFLFKLIVFPRNIPKFLVQFINPLQSQDIFFRKFNLAKMKPSLSHNTLESLEKMYKSLSSERQSISNTGQQLYHDRGNLDQALLDYTKAIELYPHDAAFYCNRGNQKIMWLGILCDNMGQDNKGILDFIKYIELNPYNAKLYYGRGCKLKAIEKDFYNMKLEIQVKHLQIPLSFDQYY